MVKTPSKFSLNFPGWTAFSIMLLISVWTGQGQQSSVLINDEGAVILSWESGASLFRIQIRRDGQVFLDKEHGANVIRLDLGPGLYEYRIATLNTFSKEDSSTAWLPLRVRSSKIPHFRLISPLDILEGEGDKTLVVESTKFREDTTLQLIKGEKRIDTEWQRNGNSYLIRLPNSLKAGSWDLEARDVSGKTFTVPGVLTVQSTQALTIHGLSVSELHPEETLPVEIVGERFDKNMSLRFESTDGTLKIVSIEVFNKKRALVYLDLFGAQPGNYTLIASNQNETEARFEGALKIKPTEESTDAKPGEVQTRVEFHAGYSPMLIIFDDGRLLPVYAAVDVAFLLQSGWKTPFFRGLGAETRIFGGISGLDSGAVSDAVFGFDVSVYYRPVLDGPIAPVFLVGIGMAHSNYAAITYNINDISVIRTGLGMDIVKNRWVTRFGVNVNTSFNEKVFPIFSLMLRQGLRY